MNRLEPTRIELLESTGGDWERIEWQRPSGQGEWEAPKRLLAYWNQPEDILTAEFRSFWALSNKLLQFDIKKATIPIEIVII